MKLPCASKQNLTKLNDPAMTSPLSHMVDTLIHGGVAILPTETVYGLAGRADDKEAVDRIYAVKGRAFAKPLALCVPHLEAAHIYGQMSGLAGELAKAFWPGPLSLIVRARNNKLDKRLYGRNAQGQKTISMRCPQADWTQALQDIPLALTSANPSGLAAPLNIDDAAAYIGDSVDAIYGGPPCSIGISSTILSIEGHKAQILRQGSLTPKDFARFNIEGDDW